MAISDKIGNVFNKAKSGTIAVSLEAKKKMKESSIRGEISSLEAKMNGVFTNIGKEAYSSQYDKLYGYDQLRGMMDSVKEIKDQIAAKEKELEEAMAQFDREIAEVKGEAPPPAAVPAAAEAAQEKAAEAPAPEAPAKFFCGECGAANNPESKFCNSCGAKLER